MFIAGFPAGSFQANCYLLGSAGSGEAVVVDPGEGATTRVLALLAEHQVRPVGRPAQAGCYILLLDASALSLGCFAIGLQRRSKQHAP